MTLTRILGRLLALAIVAGVVGTPAFAASPPPTISAIRPASGSAAGGSAIVIDGANFTTVTAVNLGGIAATIVAASSTSLTVTAPARAAGLADVVVTNAGGSTTSTGAFTYVNNDDVARDFSIAVNPSPRWSYGWEPTRGGAFTLYPTRIPGAVDQWSSGGLPNLWHNSTTVTVNQATNYTPAGKFGLHPGPSGENSVVRWTAPASGAYGIAGSFVGTDASYPTTTDVAVLHNNNAATPLFAGNIASYNVPLNFSFSVVVAAGDTIEFTVGFGGNGYAGDATLLDATITPLVVSPTITLTPASLAFAARTISTTSTAQTTTLTNAGPGALSISSITVSGDFAFTTTCPASVPALGTCDINVTFTPLTVGARTGAVSIVSNASGSPHALALSGTGLAAPVPGIHLSQSAFGFAPQTVGFESPVQIVTVTNDGSATLVFGPITASGDFVLRPVTASATLVPCAGNLSPGLSCVLGVTFRPTVAGALEGYLFVTGNAPAVVARLLGTGVVGPPPRALTVPDRVVFGAQPVGTRSNGIAMPITNNSSSTVSITELATSGDFSVSNTCTTIAPGASCSPLLFFQPRAIGDRSGSLTLFSSTETDPYVVTLGGTGVFNPLPALELSVTRAGFGNTLIGTAPTLSVNLLNIGEVPVALGGVSMTGDFIVTSDCGASLAVAASCAVHVTFFPRMTGAQVGTFEVNSNAAGGPHQVQFSGTGCSIPSAARSRLHPVLCGR